MVKGNHQKSEYENYLLVSQDTKMLGGTYPKYLKTKSLMSSLNSMVSKQSNTYIYNGESYVSSLTGQEIQKIQSALDFGTYNSSIEKLKYIFIDIGDRLF
jgi:hypothetical protein|tara:strand:+ start:346 stop:645 length:300 start_codon:yes stop_codon:yes gene_type:complete